MIVPMPMMIPMSDGEDNGVEYEYPFITEAVVSMSVTFIVIGLITAIVGVICELLNIHTTCDIGYNAMRAGVVMMLIGVVLVVISVVLMAITGTPIKE